MDFVTTYLFGLKAGSNLTQDAAFRDHFLELYARRRTLNFWPQEMPGIYNFCLSLGYHLVPTWVDDANAEIGDWTLKMLGAATEQIESSDEKASAIEDHPIVVAQLKSAMDKNTEKDSRISAASASQHLEIASEVIDHLAAGFDTSGITLTYLAHELSQRPRLQEALRNELLTLEPPIISSSGAKLPSAKQLDALPLLQAIVQETLRLHAAIPGPQPRQTPPGGCRIGPNSEYDLPGGMRISAQAWSLHRNPNVFPEPEQWKPERWLNEKGEYEVTGEMGRWWWAFGSGGRMCVGSNLAMYQMKFIVAAIWTNFVMSITDDEGIEQADIYTAPPKSNRLIVKLERVGRE